MELESIKLDPLKLERGSWWAIRRQADGSIAGEPGDFQDKVPALLIVPVGLAYERALEAAREPHLEAIRAGKLSDDARREIHAQALAAAVLRGWCGLTLGGQPLEWTEDKARELLANVAWRPFYDFVSWASGVLAAAAAREEEAAAGN